jgi:hypothetical protein
MQIFSISRTPNYICNQTEQTNRYLILDSVLSAGISTYVRWAQQAAKMQGHFSSQFNLRHLFSPSAASSTVERWMNPSLTAFRKLENCSEFAPFLFAAVSLQSLLDLFSEPGLEQVLAALLSHVSSSSFLYLALYMNMTLLIFL